MRGLIFMVMGLALAGCETLPAPDPQMSGAVHWYRNSAEKRALYEQTWRLALQELRTRAAGLADGSWGVILDVDETLLDNSGYQKEFPVYTDRTWDEWTARQSATALPGAVHFTEVVKQQMHGLVVLVTNREQKSCADTEANLQRVGVRYDRIFCMTTTSDKNPRFAAVEAGSAGQPPIQVLMWVGDNIQDFPSLSQASADFTAFGSRYFVMPNPVYGSWEALPRN